MKVDVLHENAEWPPPFAAFPNHLHAGERAPEIAGTLLDEGERLALSSIWRRRTVVVEFGSFT